jgi:hypothetical protein
LEAPPATRGRELEALQQRRQICDATINRVRAAAIEKITQVARSLREQDRP